MRRAVVFDARNSLHGFLLPEGLTRLGIGTGPALADC